ncbi:extracellular solute-binding protein [Salipiger marinus]|uniref:extracellular solute-binding protein n=1 Tax=Salipiger marinus TaxID=555512 RepID=UPI001E61D33F|nr:extracellular solute-binding protein [Salipiger manganoxidans]MCD1619557.1 extracellular solute-binding protein [Salipiger manganoxidans]MEB3419479.1 extracellular solute-binding protein [Salipiger manganoxidans]
MKHLILSAGLALSASAALAETELRVHYAIPTIWTETQDKLTAAFMAAHPEVTLTLDGPAEGYEDGAQRLLREHVAGTAPDVAYVGLNLWRVLEDRGVLQPLDPFLPADPQAAGYTPALLSLGRFEDTQWGLGTSASTLVMYVNPVLVEQAGGSMEDFPTSFDGVIELAAMIDALSDTTEGVWIARHDWRFQSLLGSHGGRPMTEDESDITFDDAAGLAAAGLYQRFATEAGMSSMSENDARQAFPAGTLGIMFESSSLLTRFTEGAGDSFDVTVKPLPVAAEENVYFPTGGNAIVMLTEDPAKQQAAWDYIAFVTGPEGQKIIVENTGYAPANKLVLDDSAYLGSYYAENANARTAHAQVADHAGPWYAFPGAEGVAVTDLIAAALVEVTEGAEVEPTITDLAETLRLQLGMK